MIKRGGGGQLLPVEGAIAWLGERAGRLILVDRTRSWPWWAGWWRRVSGADRKDELERQAGRVVAGATGRGLAVGQVERGRVGMSGHRGKPTKLLSDPAVTVIVVEHRDRLTRFGFERIEASMAAGGRGIVVLESEETTDDLVRDVTEVLTWLCARLYGRRSAAGRAAKAVAVATGTEPR